MVIGWVQRKLESVDGSAWPLVEAAQRKRCNCRVCWLPQPSHAVLAGEIANALMPPAFGELPRVISRRFRCTIPGGFERCATNPAAAGTAGEQLAPVSFVAIPPAGNDRGVDGFCRRGRGVVEGGGVGGQPAFHAAGPARSRSPKIREGGAGATAEARWWGSLGG